MRAGAQGGAARSSCSKRGEMRERARLHAHQAPRQPAGARRSWRRASRASASTATARRRSARRRWPDSRAASTACWSRPTSPRAASTSRRSAHVVNFDVPHVPDDYIHRVGRTARAEMTGDAFTFVSPEEEGDLAAIERAIGKRLPRVTVPASTTRRPRRPSVRGAARRAHRGDPRAQGRGAQRAREKAERRIAAPGRCSERAVTRAGVPRARPDLGAPSAAPRPHAPSHAPRRTRLPRDNRAGGVATPSGRRSR